VAITTTLKRMRGKTRLRKSNDEKPVTVFGLKVNGQVVSTKEMDSSLTMLDTIGVVALTVFQLALFHDMLIESANQKEAERDE
jgi:Asp-tRNA(Asn)/Glu-tRNA(Gln) amidotransferase A subunit family amidase